ncbi:VWA domain-containing protein [Mesorhizobium sp. CAU 1741]|uniref:vWA domain-containing protein n=1 Tax=Mesorhizobium sp. CAU 1741 TaxID=3140366 RepID=UPI00325C2252
MTQSSFRTVFGIAALSLLPMMAPAFAQSADAAPDKAAVLILDASGSMWGQLDGGITKIEVARDVMGQFFSTRDATIPLGVIAYGHNRRGDCADIEVIAPTGVQDAASLSQRLNRINPRGMTPISESLRIAAGQIPLTAEEADIILVTDGLETCDADPCAVAAQLANEGIKIRAHVVGFGLTEQEADALACVPDQTGGQLLRPQSGAELTDALNQIAAAEPEPEPEPAPAQEAFFDLGPKAEAGHTYRISYRGTAQPVDYAGFTPRGDGAPNVSPSYGVIGGGSTANNPFSRQAPVEPGEYDLILFVTGQGVIARQAIEVVAASNGFDPIGSVEPDKRFQFTWRGPNQLQQRIVIARPGAATDDISLGWGYPYSNRQTQRMSLKAPAEAGIYELRYITANRREILFSRAFGVGVPYEDADLTTSDELAERAAAATQAAPGQDALPMVRATFRIPDGFPEVPLSWSAVPLDPDMSPQAWSPQQEMWIAEGEFEPGRYEVSTMGPGEVEFRGVVEIFAGRANDFVIPLVGGGEEEQNPPQQRGDLDDGRIVVTLKLPPEQRDMVVQWSAVRLDRVMMDVEFAMNDRIGDYSTDFAPGRYEITGHGADFILEGEIEVAASGARQFVIPVTEYTREEGLALICGTHEGCDFNDPRTGLSLTVPYGWMMTHPSFYPTPSPVKADYPSVDLLRAHEAGHLEIRLNPHDWNERFGPCVDTSAGSLCRNIVEVPALLEPFEVIRASLKLHSPGAPPADTVLEAGTDVAVLCDGDTNCNYFDPHTGLRMVVPAGWAMGEAFFVSATAGANPIKNPRISFFKIDGGDDERFEFNPHQWLASNGPCESTLIGGVCHFAGAPDSTKLAMMTAGLYARIDSRAAATGGIVFAQQAGTTIDPRGPYAAGEKTVFIVRRDQALEGDEIAVFPATGPMSETTILTRNRDLGRGFYGSVEMPAEPGDYRIALLREGDRIVQGVSDIRVAPDPQMRFTDWNAQPFPGRPMTVNLHGRMAHDDAIAIVTSEGRELARASVDETMLGRFRTPDGLSGPHRMVHIARGAGGERVMAGVDLDIGARGDTVDAGGVGGAPVISVAAKVLAGSKVPVSVRGAIPEKPILGFIRPDAGENQILETGQHFLPQTPSTTVDAPRQTGRWMMRLADQNLWRFAEVPVEVVDYLEEASPESVSGRDIQPRDGTWTVSIGNTAVQGCPAIIADQIRNAGMQGRAASRDITFADPFHPAPLMEDAEMQVDWRKTGPGGWEANLVQDSMGTASVEARYELTVVSETELREVSRFSMQLPAEMMALIGGGDGNCTSRTSATWNWQG